MLTWGAHQIMSRRLCFIVAAVFFAGVGIAEDNDPPQGFTALFNGEDLTGWTGAIADPPKLAKMSPDKLVAAKLAADEKMDAHWKAVDGVLVFDGAGDNICTAEEYGDFELMLDYKLQPRGDTGVLLRGTPQVQIWDPKFNPIGSGGLYNNKKNPSKPLVCADKPAGEWNRMLIRMVGEKVSVTLNGKRVVTSVVMENYWDREKPLYPTGQIELQSFSTPLYFKNIYLKKLGNTK